MRDFYHKMQVCTVPETNISMAGYFNEVYQKLRFDHVFGFKEGFRHPCVLWAEADLAPLAQ
jgi:hypothetical protein